MDKDSRPARVVRNLRPANDGVSFDGPIQLLPAGARCLKCPHTAEHHTYLYTRANRDYYRCKAALCGCGRANEPLIAVLPADAGEAAVTRAMQFLGEQDDRRRANDGR
jgi:hypothetical protein